MRVSLRDTLPVANQLGECVLWDDRAGLVRWTDILGQRLYCYDPVSGTLSHNRLPRRLASFALTSRADLLVAAFDDRLSLYDTASGQEETLFLLPDTRELRFNDGRVDRSGQFWVGSMIENAGNRSDDPERQGRLYRLDRAGGVSAMRSGISISNSLCWSPDGRTAYFADSPEETIRAFDVDPRSGTWAEPRVFARTPAGVHPDGATVDAEGCVWSAQWGSGKVVRYSPQGECIAQIDLPARQLTCVAFGGADLSTLYVTSARCDLTPAQCEDQPVAGHLFVLDTNIRGLPESRYILGRG
nr:SMP-30/gluconolactonase/LRE family protein [Microbulbifer salipaludis]